MKIRLVLESELLYSVAWFYLTALNHLEVDAPQLEVLTGGRADQLQGFITEPGSEFLASGVGLGRGLQDGRTDGDAGARGHVGFAQV